MARAVIVGAGPAGSSAAWHLASRGHDVTLIDRAAFPRPKTCGDWITSRSVAELARLGLGADALARRATERATITRTMLVAPNGRSTAADSRDIAYCIPRLVLDAMLWRHAVAAGCRPLRCNIRAIGTGDGAFLRDADYVIDARGAHAGSPNAVALRAYWTVPRAALSPDEENTVQIHTDAEYRRGYGWMFPVHVGAGDVRFNVGVGLWAADGRPGADIRRYHDRFIATNPVLIRWRAAATCDRAVGCHVGLGLRANRVADADHVLRIGDAANLADPLTGDGIGNALLSGRLAAEAIDASRDGVDAATRWQALHDRALVPELRAALLLRSVLTTTPAKNTAAWLLNAAPALRSRVHAAFFGESTYREICGPRQ